MQELNNNNSNDSNNKTEPKPDFLQRIRNEAVRLFSLPPDTHQEKAVQEIKKNIEFKGVNLWALIFACLIASVGLNMGSTAVIIGAMLISPLMGPIVGIGFAVGTNDFEVLKNAFRNLLIMTFLSLAVAVIYFALSPIKESSAELLGRIRPTLYDVMIAVSGGVIGIIAASRRDLTNVIPGVAIATALMPPICTAGYGIATLQFQYFIGAFYLFFINALFIALSTTVVVHYLKFPKKELADKKQERKVRLYIGTLVVLGLIPSIFTAWLVVQEALFVSNVNKFVNEKFVFENTTVLKPINTRFSLDSSTVEIILIGQALTPDELDRVRSYMKYYGLQRTKLNIRQSEKALEPQQQNTVNYASISKLLEGKDDYIKNLEKEIEDLKATVPKFYMKPISLISKKIMAYYPEIKEIGFSETFRTVVLDSVVVSDTIPSAVIKWRDKKLPEDITQRIQNALKIEFDVDSVMVISY